MKWADIDFANRTLTISRSMGYRHSTGEWRVGEPKSKSGYRSIPLTEEALDMLRRQRKKNLEVHACIASYICHQMYRGRYEAKDVADDTWTF